MSLRCTKAQLIAVMMTFVAVACNSPQLPVPVLSPVAGETPAAPIRTPEIAPVQKPVIPPYEYILNLSLASLAFQQSPANLLHAQPWLSAIEEYTGQIQATVALQPVIMLEYTRPGQGDALRIAVPFTMPQQDESFPALTEAMHYFNQGSYVLQDVQLLVVKITPAAAVRFSDYDGMTAEKSVNTRLQALLVLAPPLTQVADVKVELQLSRFFMRHHERDGAWLALENARQSMVGITRAATLPAADIDNLTRQVENQEILLHKTMPFTLGF